MNARTASENATVIDCQDSTKTERVSVCPRKSEDCLRNQFGEQLIELCSLFDLTILNGMDDCQRCFDGGCTFISSAGASTVDYFLSSLELCQSLPLESLTIGCETESDHLPVMLSITRTNHRLNNSNTKQKRKSKKARQNHKWKKDKEPKFIEKLKKEEIKRTLQSAIEMIESDLDAGVQLFVDGLSEASECMANDNSIRKESTEWFDEDCQACKDFVKARNSYRRITKKKKLAYNRDKASKLAQYVADSTCFWKELENMGGGKQGQTLRWQNG